MRKFLKKLSFKRLAESVSKINVMGRRFETDSQKADKYLIQNILQTTKDVQ